VFGVRTRGKAPNQGAAQENRRHGVLRRSFQHIDLEDGVERFVTVAEQSRGALVPGGRLSPDTLHTISVGAAEMPSIYQIQIQIQSIPGTGKANVSGVAPREAVRVAFNHFKANSYRVSASIKIDERDFRAHLVELRNSGSPQALTLASFIALCAATLAKPVQSQLTVMGDMSLDGTVVQVRNLAECMQVAFDAGAKRIPLPMSSVTDIATVLGELLGSFKQVFTLTQLMPCLKLWVWSSRISFSANYRAIPTNRSALQRVYTLPCRPLSSENFGRDNLCNFLIKKNVCLSNLLIPLPVLAQGETRLQN